MKDKVFYILFGIMVTLVVSFVGLYMYGAYLTGNL